MEKGFDLLKFNHAGVLLLKNGESMDYGVIRIENESLVHYTGKGLKELFSPNLSENEKTKAEEIIKLGENELVNRKYIAITPLFMIKKVLS